MSGEIGDGGTVGVLEREIQARAEALANRIGLDFVASQPTLMLVLMIENILDRVETLEEIYPLIQDRLKEIE